MRIIFAFGVLLLLCGSAARAADESVTVEGVKDFPEGCKLIRQAQLPFQWVNGQMVVEVTVNEHPLHFVVDTGAVFSAIDHTVAKGIGLGLGPLGFDYTITDAGGAQIRNIVRVDDIKFGTLKSGSLTLVSVALPKGEDGLLAPDLLRNFDVEFDPAHQVINLFKPHSCSDHVVYWTSDFTKIQATKTDQGQPRIAVSIDGVPARAVLDTGLAHTFISTDATKSVLGPKPALGPTHHMTAENGGDLSGSEVRLDSFVVGKLNLVGAVVLANAHAPGWQFGHSEADSTITGFYGDFVPSSPGAAPDNSQVLVGTDILQNLHMLIDYQSWQIYVSK